MNLLGKEGIFDLKVYTGVEFMQKKISRQRENEIYNRKI